MFYAIRSEDQVGEVKTDLCLEVRLRVINIVIGKVALQLSATCDLGSMLRHVPTLGAH